jgi:hypothetical protein
MEQRYFNRKRWLLNRLVTGYGVVCGLELDLTDERDAIIVLPGLAIDKWGREIEVPRPSAPIPVERLPGAPDGEEEWIYLCLGYHECESDPAPVLTAACDEPGPCAADTIQERYFIKARAGRVPDRRHECNLIDLVDPQGVRFEELVRWASERESCHTLPEDPCIPLGDIYIPDEGTCHTDDVHSENRPIVYSNDLLYEIILALAEELLQVRRYGRKG